MFCPYETGRPYKDKLTLFWSGDDMLASENDGFMLLADGTFSVRLGGEIKVVDIDDAACGVPEAVRATIKAVRDNYGYLFVS